MLLDQVINKKLSPPTVIKKEGKIPAETAKRSLAKTVSWRILGTMDTILIAWFITGTVRFAFSIGAIELISKMILYYVHERIWITVKFGKP